MIFTSSWAVDVWILFGTIVFALYKYLTRNYDYFKKKNIPYAKPIPLLGSALSVVTFKQTMGIWLQSLYNSINKPCFGIFVLDEPYLVLRSPELIKDILVKNFNKFSDRTILSPNHNDIVANMLFMQKNPRWRQTRIRMTPVFTSGKLKGMFPIVNEVGKEMKTYVENNLGKMDAKDVSVKFSTEVIARCAFGISGNAFKEEETEMREVGRRLFESSWRNGVSQPCYFLKQSIASRLRLEFFPKSDTDFLRKTFWDTIKMREKSHIKRNDLIDIILEMRKDKELCDDIDFDGDTVVAQAVQFFAAGYETTSSTASFTLYELCIHPEIQSRLREEILEKIQTYGITYDSLKQMKYLDMCIFETLRKYPVLPFLDRKCNEEHQLSGTDLIIEEGMSVYIPLMGLHYDETFFPDPEKYNPERFSDGNVHNTDGLYYLPFGGGPRICIGERFAMMGVKMTLVHIILEFILEKTSETPIPIVFDPKSFLLQSNVGLPMKFKKLPAQL